QQLSDQLARAGADGADLLVRTGQTVTPDTVGRVADTARALRDNGLGLGMVSTDLTEADHEAERVIGHCAEAGATLLRLGFYRYDVGLDHTVAVDQARRNLAGLAGLAAQHGVRLVLALHHGTLHPSGAHAARLLADLDTIQVHPDPGNQAKEGGEDWRLTLDAIGGLERVGCVGVKNAVWQADTYPGEWTCSWQPFADGGVVPWRAILPGLAGAGYRGPLSLHVHYATDDPFAAVRRDVAHLRGLLSEAGLGAPAGHTAN
ncbi:sugar phosphate isomerase/epimerase family protein, partial [Streptomyces sp. NPDC048425]|uniref:sugar phosphate isomerase/epimerase family protein n=1 Tax=Streptomyces sp. NPDC048425 TaxID=3365548 RepID=UPI0037167303